MITRKTTSARSIINAIDKQRPVHSTYAFKGRRFTNVDRPGIDPGTPGRTYQGPGVKPQP